MKKYIILFAVIFCFLVVPTALKAQQKPAVVEKPVVLIAPVQPIVAPTNQSIKIARVAEGPKIAVMPTPITGLKVATPQTQPLEPLIIPRPVTGLKISPPPVNIDKTRESTIKQK